MISPDVEMFSSENAKRIFKAFPLAGTGKFFFFISGIRDSVKNGEFHSGSIL
jgi:hypothetical protein